MIDMRFSADPNYSCGFRCEINRIRGLPGGRRDSSTNLLFFFIHEFARIRRICTNYSCGFRCEFNRILGLPGGRWDSSTNLLFFLSTNLHESGELALITVAGLGANLIELGGCLAADGFVICELFFLSTN